MQLTLENVSTFNRYASWLSNSTRGICWWIHSNLYIKNIEYITIATLGDAVDFGNLTASRNR